MKQQILSHELKRLKIDIFSRSGRLDEVVSIGTERKWEQDLDQGLPPGRAVRYLGT
jgi:hypothetical protein